MRAKIGSTFSELFALSGRMLPFMSSHTQTLFDAQDMIGER